MKVKALEKEWEIKPINPEQQQKLYVAYMACQGDVKVDGKKVIEIKQTIEEKEKQYNLFFEALELSEIKDVPESLVEMSVLGMAILTEYCGLDKKKLPELELQDG